MQVTYVKGTNQGPLRQFLSCTKSTTFNVIVLNIQSSFR